MRSADDGKDTKLPASIGYGPKLGFLTIPIESPPAIRTSYLRFAITREGAFAETDQSRTLIRSTLDHPAYRGSIDRNLLGDDGLRCRQFQRMLLRVANQ
jgi:hypothetical protein